MNPIDMLKGLMSKGLNPQKIAMSMINNNSNPMISNLVKMANQGNSSGIENFARNLYKEKGMDFDKEFAKFMNNFR